MKSIQFVGLLFVSLVFLPAHHAFASDVSASEDTLTSFQLDDIKMDARDDDDEEEEEEEEARRGRRSNDDENRASRGATGRKRIIKVVQRRHFMKLHRLETTFPSIGMVTNDPFLRRILFAGKFEFHVTEVSSIGAYIAFSPNMGDSDLKQLTSKLQEQKEVVPDISRIIFAGIVDVGFSPIFGKVELGTTRIINYDLYLAAGAGILYTHDDEELITGGRPEYFKQVHPVTSLAFGFRIAFNEWFGVRVEARLLTHIEQVHRDDGMNLEMKNNFAVQFGPSFFLPPKMKSTAR